MKGKSGMDNPEKLATLGTQDTRRRQSRETGDIGYTRHTTKRIQRNWRHWVHKTHEEDKQSKQNATQKTKKMSIADPTKDRVELKHPRKARSHRLTQDTSHVSYIANMCWTPLIQIKQISLPTNNWMHTQFLCGNRNLYKLCKVFNNEAFCQCNFILTSVFGENIHIKSIPTTTNVVMSRKQNKVRNHLILTTLSS